MELIGEVLRVGSTSLEVEASAFREAMCGTYRQLAMVGRLTFLAVDDAQRRMARPVHGAHH